MNQEVLALTIVAFCFLIPVIRHLRAPIANWLLKQGKVKWAMLLRHGRKGHSSGDCH